MALRQSLAGAKRAVAPQPDPMRGHFEKVSFLELQAFICISHTEHEIGKLGIPLAATVPTMPMSRLSSKSHAYRRTLIKIGKVEDFAWFPEVPEHATADPA